MSSSIDGFTIESDFSTDLDEYSSWKTSFNCFRHVSHWSKTAVS